MKCNKHPAYKGVGKPTGACITCWDIFKSNKKPMLSVQELTKLAKTSDDDLLEVFSDRGFTRADLRRLKKEYLNEKEKNPLILRQELTQTEQELSNATKTIEELRKQGTAFEILTRKILDTIPSVTRFPKFKPIKFRKGNLKAEEWVHLISDMQIGSSISSTETGGLGQFSTEKFKKESQYYYDSLSDIRAYHTTSPKSNRIFLMGDIIDGTTIFKGQSYQVDRYTIDQVWDAVETLTELIYRLAKEFPLLKLYGVPGNHGRIGEKGQNPLMDNFDILVYRWIKDRLKYSGVNNVTFDISPSWYQLVYVNSWVFLIEHGDGFKSWGGIPFYGAMRMSLKMQNLFRDYKVEFVDESYRKIHLTEKFHYLTVADKHVPAEFTNIIMNGCWPGGSQLSLKYMQEGGTPSQKLFAVDKDHGITWKRDVYLEKPRAETKKLPLYT